MDIQIFVTPDFSDLFLWGGIGLIVFSIVYLQLSKILENTRRKFRAIQPDLHISRSATVYSNGEDTLTIFIRNAGGSPAVDIRVTVHGGEGLDPLPVIPVMNSGDLEHEVWVKAKAGSPLLQEKKDSIQLHIHYRDQWGHFYSVTHPVVQRESIHGWVALHLVERVNSRVSTPSISFWCMRMGLLLHTPTVEAMNTEKVIKVDRVGGCDGLLGQPQELSYLTRVWQFQNKECRARESRQFSPLVSSISSH